MSRPASAPVDPDLRQRGHWTGHWGFVLAAAGSAVGLGNIWKFPYMTGQNGGSAFVLVYLACIAIVGLPVMMAEILLGRRAQRNPAVAMALLAREARASTRWRFVGIAGVLAGAIILSYYSVVAGWMLDYLARATTGAFDAIGAKEATGAFKGLLADGLRLSLWHTLFMLMTIAVVARGVHRGLEAANRILMPALIVILFLLLGYGIVRGDMSRAASFMFDADFSKLTPNVVLAAMGQAFFTLSIGMGAMMAYGSYLRRDVSIAHTAFYVAITDTVFAILAGLAVFAIVFGHGMTAAAGPGLVMHTLPIAFGNIPGGTVIGILFFLLIVFAAWTSAISILEPGVSWCAEQTRLTRGQANALIGGIIWLMGVAVALSFNAWQDIKLFGLGLFDLFDYLTSNIMLPLGGLMIVAFAGWVLSSAHAREELAAGRRLFGLWHFTVRYISPVVILFIFLSLTGLLAI
jgi:neurotransmitter:Na+ symporter, NSS family